MEAFDFITGNLDRFYDRNLIKSNGKLYAIDNRLPFHPISQTQKGLLIFGENGRDGPWKY